MPGAWPCAFLRRSPRRCRFLRDRAQDLCAKRTALCRKRQPGVSGGRYMPEWPIAAGQAFWEACGLASTAKTTPAARRRRTRYIPRVRALRLQVAPCRLGKGRKAPRHRQSAFAESTRHILTPTVSIDHSSTVYSPAGPVCMAVPVVSVRRVALGRAKVLAAFPGFQGGGRDGMGVARAPYRRSRLSASGRRAGWLALFTLPRMKWGAYGFWGDGRIWGVG